MVFNRKKVQFWLAVRSHKRVAQTIHVLDWDSMKLLKLAEITFRIISPNQTTVSKIDSWCCSFIWPHHGVSNSHGGSNVLVMVHNLWMSIGSQWRSVSRHPFIIPTI